MHTLFSLQVIESPHQVSYQHQALEWARHALPEVVRFDLDSLSDGLTLQYARDLLGQSEKVLLVVEVKAVSATAGGLLPFLEQFIAHPQAFAVLPGSEHPLVHRMLNLLPPERIQRPTADWSDCRPFIFTSLSR
jgi:hypothetical protein